LSHCGEEHSVQGGDFLPHLGNPLLLRSALKKGVKVIAAHCASEGTGLDLDLLDSFDENPEATEKTKPEIEKAGSKTMENFDLFLRMMKEEQYNDLLYADISSMTAFARCSRPLWTMIDAKEFHHRLLPGSDYPVPCLAFVVQTRLLYWLGYLNWDEVGLLNEIFKLNPLLFDYVLKRTLRSPKTKEKWPASLFQANTRLLPNL